LINSKSTDLMHLELCSNYYLETNKGKRLRILRLVCPPIIIHTPHPIQRRRVILLYGRDLGFHIVVGKDQEDLFLYWDEMKINPPILFCARNRNPQPSDPTSLYYQQRTTTATDSNQTLNSESTTTSQSSSNTSQSLPQSQQYDVSGTTYPSPNVWYSYYQQQTYYPYQSTMYSNPTQWVSSSSLFLIHP
jgi:hypothetical protein